MPNPENLKGHEFKKGKEWNGNKNGRPSKSEMLKQLEEKLADNWEDFKIELVNLARKNPRYLEILFDRVFGKPKQTIDTNVHINELSEVIQGLEDLLKDDN